ncbi:MAG: hypothetical protein IJI10_04665 [Eubacterium sp.]|nr:hypothetical protein [Eubacterium sp.]
MSSAGITAGLSVLLDWIPAVGMIVLIPSFLIRRHRYRQEQQRLETVIASYEAACGQEQEKQEETDGKAS